MRKRGAARHLIALEIYLGVTMIGWGIAGGIDHANVLHWLLARERAVGGWLLTLIVVGGLQAGCAAFEWTFGRYWPIWRDGPRPWQPSVHASSSVRAVVAFVAVGVWLYVGLWLLIMQGEQVAALSAMGLASAAFSFWTWFENMKVRYALDPRIPTSTLHFDR